MTDSAAEENMDGQNLNLEAISRCETILNVTCAEMNRAMSERRDDLRRAVELYLSAQVQRHEQVSQKEPGG